MHKKYGQYLLYKPRLNSPRDSKKSEQSLANHAQGMKFSALEFLAGFMVLFGFPAHVLWLLGDSSCFHLWDLNLSHPLSEQPSKETGLVPPCRGLGVLIFLLRAYMSACVWYTWDKRFITKYWLTQLCRLGSLMICGLWAGDPGKSVMWFEGLITRELGCILVQVCRAEHQEQWRHQKTGVPAQQSGKEPSQLSPTLLCHTDTPRNNVQSNIWASHGLVKLHHSCPSRKKECFP